MFSKVILNETQLRRAFLIHAFCWSLFIVYEMTFLYYAGRKFDSVTRYICYYAVNIGFFYLQIHIFNITFHDGRRKYLKGLCLILIMFSANLFIRLCLVYFLEGMQLTVMNAERKKAFLTSNIYRMFYFSVLAGFYSLADHIGRYRKQSLLSEKKQLEAENEKSAMEMHLAEAKNAYLQQQMNPHLLFNTLNFLYTASFKSAPSLSKSVLLLSDMVRFNLEGPGTDGKVLLTDELEQIYNLVEITKQQFEHSLHLDIIVEGEINGCRIIPLVLMTLTENVFKHGNLIESDHPATISIRVNEQQELTYISRNLKKEPNGFQRIRSLGIQNIRTRMDFSYSGRYGLETVESENYFETNLWVEL